MMVAPYQSSSKSEREALFRRKNWVRSVNDTRTIKRMPAPDLHERRGFAIFSTKFSNHHLDMGARADPRPASYRSNRKQICRTNPFRVCLRFEAAMRGRTVRSLAALEFIGGHPTFGAGDALVAIKCYQAPKFAIVAALKIKRRYYRSADHADP